MADWGMCSGRLRWFLSSLVLPMRSTGALGTNEELETIDALIDWAPVAAVCPPPDPQGPGRERPACPATKMLKALYLAVLYQLSDPALEAALSDWLSFRRFCGFGLAS